MSVGEGVCDWCGRDRLMETGDELSAIQDGKLWCGRCREGSKARYEGISNSALDNAILMFTAMLDKHPIRYEPPHDHMRMHFFKLQTSDEIGRMSKELKFREEEQE